MVKQPVDKLLPINGIKWVSVKRFFDIFLSCMALVILAPVLGLLAIGIRVSSSGPILYRAKRVGLNGTLFTMYKFRTMHHFEKDHSSSVITAKNDQRIFALGTWLRLLKLDELPQIFNILRGEMSIIGPRPEDPHIVRQYYTNSQLETLNVLPGLASPGSLYNYTHGDDIVGEIQPEKAYVEQLLPLKLAFDTVYVHETSLMYDINIILRTIQTVLLICVGKRHFSDPPEMNKVKALVVDNRIAAHR